MMDVPISPISEPHYCDSLTFGIAIAAPVPTRKVGIMEQNEGQVVASKRQERLAFLLLTAVVFPLATVLIVAGYGFLVWMWQLLYAGPPTGH